MTSGTKVGGRTAANPTDAVRTSTENRLDRRQLAKRSLAVAGIGLIGIAGLARQLRGRVTEDA